jgi:hypothetical protein
MHADSPVVMPDRLWGAPQHIHLLPIFSCVCYVRDAMICLHPPATSLPAAAHPDPRGVLPVPDRHPGRLWCHPHCQGWPPPGTQVDIIVVIRHLVMLDVLIRHLFRALDYMATQMSTA